MHFHPRILTGTHIRLEPVTPAHREEMRAALDCDQANWDIQVVSARGEHFAVYWGSMLHAPGRVAFAVRVLATGALAGTSSFLFVDPQHGTLEIGSTWFRPEYRGGVVNLEAKLLMLGEAFGGFGGGGEPPPFSAFAEATAHGPPPSAAFHRRLRPRWSLGSSARERGGFERVAFRVDDRNARSLAAMTKLGAVREGVARGHFLTWTGHRRSSVVFSILRDEWPRVRAGLEARLADL